jgi:6-phosphogluconolactonase
MVAAGTRTVDVLTENLFESRQAASAAAAADMASCLRQDLALHKRSTIVVSGGTTPAQCFDILSQEELAWKRVRLAMSDERWVPATHEDSNEKLIRETLRRNAAKQASILSIYQGDLSVDERCDSLQKQRPRQKFACALLGMGADGHFASLFPDADNLPIGLDKETTRFYLPVRTEASPHPRVSMTLAALLRSNAILLLFFGDEKRAVLDKAMAGDSSLPISALLEQQQTPVALYWAP